MAFPIRLLHSQLGVSVPKPTESFEGQTIIVTGANTGLGFEAAKQIVHLGASRVIIGCRNVKKGEAAKITLEEATKCSSNVIEVWQIDLASYDSVKRFATKADQLPRLDVLLENAGIMEKTYQVAEDNELTVTVNVVSTFLLGILLLPKLRETALRFNVTSCMTVVSSDLHFLSSFPERKSQEIFKTLNDRQTARMGDRYNVSKLMEILIIRHLVSLAKPSSDAQPQVILNTVNPGYCHSGLARNTSFGVTVFKYLLARTTEEGARNLVIAASAGKKSHGKYIGDGKIMGVSPFVTDEKGVLAGKRVWEELSKKLELIQPGILQNV
ncbi:MAG: hypothetical protein M1827_005255 [Pycnora praestabilis]|nr:MAG: hypothetical protein M1827_005255 [Pycnora praestabilis]